MGNNDIQKMIQNFLEAKSDVKIYDIKKHWKLFLENSFFAVSMICSNVF
jgi:hypothetical protein